MENKMEHEIENGQLIISFYGEIDGYNVAYYRNKLNVLLAINDDDVIFDFKHTTFIDSAGVGLVLGRYQQLSSPSYTSKATAWNLPCFNALINASGSMIGPLLVLTNITVSFIKAIVSSLIK